MELLRSYLLRVAQLYLSCPDHTELERNMADSVGNFRKELLHAGKGEVPSFQKNSKVGL